MLDFSDHRAFISPKTGLFNPPPRLKIGSCVLFLRTSTGAARGAHRAPFATSEGPTAVAAQQGPTLGKGGGGIGRRDLGGVGGYQKFPDTQHAKIT